MQDHDHLVASTQRALRRLLVCSEIRDLTNYPRPVTVRDLSRTFGLLSLVFGLFYGSGALSRPRATKWRLRFMLDPIAIVVLRLLLYRWTVWRAIPGTFGAVHRKLRRRYRRSSSEITGYVSSTDKEEPLIRVCLLAYALGRYGVCVDFLMQRLISGLPATRTRQWLSFFLREIGDLEMAALISPQGVAKDLSVHLDGSNDLTPSPSVGSSPTRLKYGLLVLTMFDSDAFRSSLLSLLRSDFHGEIVVVEDGNQPERQCEAFCHELPVKYVKNPRWTGAAGAMNLGIERMEPDTDIVIYGHSDVLWSPQWFGHLNGAWDRVYNLNAVGIINLGYMQFDSRHGATALRELFVQGGYEDLIWLVQAMRDVEEPMMGHIQDVQSKDVGYLFGLASDPWRGHPAELRIMVGDLSVGTSFPLQTWQDIGGFDPEISAGPQVELFYHGFQNRKWNLWINNAPLIHMVSTDTSALKDEDQLKRVQMNQKTYEVFKKKYGWEIEHLVFTYFAETAVIYQDEIVKAANGLRFSDIDFVFDDLFERLRSKKLSSCELVWCLSRATCKYV